MKKISLKKAIVIILSILIIIVIILFLCRDLFKEKSPEKEAELPSTEAVYDPYMGSLVDRQDAVDVAELFDYKIQLDVETTKEAYVKLSDGSTLYFNNENLTSNANITSQDGNIIIETGSNNYRLEMKKIYNKEFEYIINNYSDDAENLNSIYSQIKDEYMSIYNNSEEQSYMEFGGIGTYKKLVKFIDENNLQRDIGLYTCDQVKSVIEKAYGITISDEYSDYQTVTTSEYSDLISYQLLKLPEDIKVDSKYAEYDSYYLFSFNNDIYACHLNCNIDVETSDGFDSVLHYVSLN